SRRTLSRTRARSRAVVQGLEATPITGTLSAPLLTIAWSAGKIFLKARSPVAPKSTSASDGPRILAPFLLSFGMPADTPAQGRGLGVSLALAQAGVGVPEDAQALGVGGHQAVLDAVMDHLDEAAGAVGAAVQVAALGGAGRAGTARRARRGLHSRRQARED